jgi:hypothetical protein
MFVIWCSVTEGRIFVVMYSYITGTRDDRATDNGEEFFGGWWTKHLYTDSSLGNYAENTAVKSVDDEFSGRETAEIGRVYRCHCCRP